MILEDPFDDPPDLPVPDRSPEPTREQLDVSVAPLTWTLLVPLFLTLRLLMLRRVDELELTRPSMTPKGKKVKSWRRF